MKKCNVELTGEALNFLEKLSEKEGKTIGKLVGESIGLKKFFIMVKEDGGRIIHKERKGREYEMEL